MRTPLAHPFFLTAASYGLAFLAVLNSISILRAEHPELGRMLIDEQFQSQTAPSPVKGFTAYDGLWRLQDGVLWASGTFGPKLMYEELVFAAGEVGVEVFLPDARDGNAGLIVKTSQVGIGADAFTGYEVSLNSAAQCLVFGRHRQNFEHIRNVPCAVPVGQWIPLVVRMTENSLEISVGGKTVEKYVDQAHPLARGAIGFRPWQRDARFRNLWVKLDGQERKIALEPVDPAADSGVLGGWQAVRRGTARGQFVLRPPTADWPRQTQELQFGEGQGAIGIATAGPRGAGLPWVAGKAYTGAVWLRCESAAELFLAAEDAQGTSLAEIKLAAAAGASQSLPFTLTPRQDAPAGRLVLTLRSPSQVRLNRVQLQPGDWAWPETLATEQLPPLAIVARQPLSAPPAVGQDLWAAQPRSPGCAIRIVEPAHPERPVKTIFSDPEGCIYDLNVSFDARTLLFSYRPRGERYWHIWRINTDGTGLQQLTSGNFYDINPCLLPDGDVLFVSTRRFGHTVCQPGPASNLHRMAPDGSDVRCVSMNTLSDFSPQMLPDGRVLFTRWEYIDRDLTYRQSLWTQDPEGSVYQLFFGNTVRDVGSFLQARPLPGRSDQVVATFAPHHGFPHGSIGLIDRSFGLETPKGTGYVYVTKEFPSIGDGRYEWAYRDPFPISAQSFLCSYGGGNQFRYRIYLLDVHDRKRLLYEEPELGCYFPIPLQPTLPPPVTATRLASKPAAGRNPASGPTPVASLAPSLDDADLATFLVADVYRGLEPAIARGRIKYLRVMEQVRKSEELISRAYDQSPVMSYATYYAKRCWGTVPVEEDGSAYFTAPALREIYFQVLDAEGRELQRMTSAVQVMPGERISCLGCHEPRQWSPPTAGRTPLALRRPPRALEKLPWGHDGIVDFPTIVQPVLNKYCVRCHSGVNPDGGCDLSGDKTRYFNMAYDNLLGRSRSYRQHNMDTGEMLPEERAKGLPLVHFFWLLRTPTAVNQPLWTGCFASRLPEYLEAKHCEQELPLADRQRIYLWIDANVPYYGTYAHSRPQAPGRRDLCCDAATGQLSPWFARDYMGVYERRCASCHGKLEGTTDWEGRFAWINFTNPQLSPALTAHLSKAAGGRGIDKLKDGQPPPRFTSTADPDYQIMLKAIETGKRLALETPEADMPGFQGARPEP